MRVDNNNSITLYFDNQSERTLLYKAVHDGLSKYNMKKVDHVVAESIRSIERALNLTPVTLKEIKLV